MPASARPQDDFFTFVNGNWLARNPIPPNEARWGAFIVLRRQVESQLKKIVETTQDRQIRDLYYSGMDMKRRNALGAKPLAPWLADINALRSRHDLLALIGRLETIGLGMPFHITVDQDAKNSTRSILYLEQGGLGMPDRDYYLKNAPEERRVRAAYQKHIERLFVLLGVSKGEAFGNMKIVMAIETRLAKASMDKVSLRDPDKTYHKKTAAALRRATPAMNWTEYFAALGAPRLGTLILSQPAFMEEVNHLIEKLPLQHWKTYLSFHVANSVAAALSQDFVDQSFSFYGKTLSGQKKIKPLWRRSLSAVNSALGEAVGKVYVKRYFPPEAKRRMNRLVDDLVLAFDTRLDHLSWMSATTKKRARKKLRAIVRKVGYPTRWKSYRGLPIRKHDYLGNLVRAESHEHRRMVRKLGKPIDRHEWFMTPQTVNAYYSPTMNEIVFPAAILQKPFFGLSADDALNYGAIGSTIGHEITHGFDDQGAKFNAAGNLKRWWTPLDKKRFERKSKMLVRQFDAYPVAPGIRVNGALTLGENIADLGGTAIAYDAYQARLKKSGWKIKKGLTPEQRFFIAYAVAWREKARPQFLKTMVAVNPHAPDRFRANGPLSNMPEFYAAFGVEKGDALYRAPRKRAKIW